MLFITVMEKLNVAASVSQETFIILSVAKYFCANFKVKK